MPERRQGAAVDTVLNGLLAMSILVFVVFVATRIRSGDARNPGTSLTQEQWTDLQRNAVRIGNGTGPIRVIAFSDFQCQSCRTSAASISALRRRYADNVAFGFINYPIASLHPQAMAAAEAAECASQQGVFAEFHDAAFESQQLIVEQEWDSVAALAGVQKPEVFARCLATHAALSRVKAHLELGQRLGVAGVPTFVIDGVFRGALAPSRLAVIVDSMMSVRVR